MSAHLVDHTSLHRHDWSSRTEDLDATTSDLQHENTSDLEQVRTVDVQPAKQSTLATAIEPVSPPIRTAYTPMFPVPSAAGSMPAPIAGSLELAAARAVGPGSILDDRYLLEKPLGSGGTALVFGARDLRAADKSALRARIAIKVPKVEAKDPERAISRLQHEFRHAQTLSHPNIVQVFDLANDQQTWFMTMELIEGKSLTVLLRDWQVLSDARKRTILRSCADALSFAHSREIVHGDFKPSNVLVSADGQAKVFDFGAASALSGEDTRIPAGTPAYASPQVLNGMRPEARDDVFSFACVAYELLTGQHPFDKRSSLEARDADTVPPRAWNLSASQWLALLSALAWEREERPADIETLMQGLFTEPQGFMNTKLTASVINADAATASYDFVPPQRSWGFISFLLVAVAIAFFISQRDTSETNLGAETALAATAVEQPTAREPIAISPSSDMAASVHSTLMAAPLSPAKEQKLFSGEGPNISAEAQSKPQPPKTVAKPAPISAISFADAQIVAPEGSIAAVFVVSRTAPLSGRTTVRWQLENGSAAAGDDFIASPSGTVEFADGQSQRAIYIPLRNDLDAEGDETFSLQILTPKRGRLGSVSRVEATIRDDD